MLVYFGQCFNSGKKQFYLYFCRFQTTNNKVISNKHIDYFYSCVLGGLIAFVSFNTDTSSGAFLSDYIIRTVYIVFSVLAALGLVILGLLRRPSKKIEENQDVNKEVKKSSLNDVAENFCEL